VAYANTSENSYSEGDMSEKLKPCPFCNGMDLHVVAGVAWGVKCHGCWSKVQCKDSRADAIRVWNNRPDNTLIDTLVEALERLEQTAGLASMSNESVRIGARKALAEAKKWRGK
jgi:hypothetical protein